MEELLKIRRHLRVVHHVPGRIRIRIGLGAMASAGDLDQESLTDFISNIEGIEDIRLNPAAASLVVSYDAGKLSPQWWEVLLNGSEEEAIDLFQNLLESHYKQS